MPNDQFIEDILSIPVPSAPFPGLGRPTRPPEANVDSIFDTNKFGSAPEDISLSQKLKTTLADWAQPIGNAALGATLTPGGGIAKTIGGALGLLNNENPFLSLSNYGLATHAGVSKLNNAKNIEKTLSKVLPKSAAKTLGNALPKEATKQFISSAVPAAASVAMSDDPSEALDAAAVGVPLQTALGAMADFKNNFGQRGAIKDVNQTIRVIKNSMAPTASNKDSRAALASAISGQGKLPQVFQQHPEVYKDIQKLQQTLPTAKQRDLTRSPIREVAAKQLDSYLTGSKVKKDFDKSIPLAKLRSYREAFPNSNEIEQAYVSRIFKDIKLAEIVQGTADAEHIKKTLNAIKLDPEAGKIIFGDSRRARQFQETIAKLPEALHKASATINPANLGSTVGANGVRLGIMGALIDPNAWVNIFTKKEFSEKQKNIISALDLINSPAKIKELETQLGKTGVTSNLIRSIGLTLADANKTTDDTKPADEITKTISTPPAVIREKQ